MFALVGLCRLINALLNVGTMRLHKCAPFVRLSGVNDCNKRCFAIHSEIELDWFSGPANHCLVRDA